MLQSKIQINIEAADTLFFRDGKPFTMGEDTHGTGLFPPPPSVVLGALRSAFMADGLASGSHFTELVKTAKKIKLEALFLKTDGGDGGINFCVPMPSDLVVAKGSGSNSAEYLTLLDITQQYYSQKEDLKLDKILVSPFPKVDESPRLISTQQLRRYLEGRKTTTQKLDAFLTSEYKIGIERINETHIADNGMLYRVPFRRPESIDEHNRHLRLSFAVEISGVRNFPTDNWIQLGGERKVAFMKSETSFPEVKCPELGETNQFKIYLATPALFRLGWKPEKILKDYGLKIIAAAVGKPVNIGGWDLENNEPKPMLQAVSAGTVYYVKALDDNADIQTIAEKIHSQSISELDTEGSGLGIAYIGKIQE